MGSKRIMDIIGITFSTVGVCILQHCWRLPFCFTV